jgi:hypothetical protein
MVDEGTASVSKSACSSGPESLISKWQFTTGRNRLIKDLADEFPRVENGPVDVKHDTIHVLTGDGYVYAPRHPGM